MGGVLANLSRRWEGAGVRLCRLAVAAVLVVPSAVHAQLVAPGTAASLTPAEQERFLLTADLTAMRRVNVGVSGTRRATLSDGRITHDASIQAVDLTRQRHETSTRVEFNVRDFWAYNVAAYRLGVLLGLDMIPPSVVRRHDFGKAAFTWWIDDVVMDERARATRNVEPPDWRYHTDQVHVMRVFDALIANTDRNQGNVLFDAQWKLWMIDHTRAFRLTTGVRTPQMIRRCERALFERMRGLTREMLAERMDGLLTAAEQAALLKRRDRLVAHITRLGPDALYDLRPPLASRTSGAGTI